MGLSIVPGQDFEIVDNLSDDVMTPIGEEYHALMARKGMTQSGSNACSCKYNCRFFYATSPGDADAMLCGTFGTYGKHLRLVEEIIGRDGASPVVGALTVLILPQGPSS